MKKYNIGMYGGKFLPLHVGHNYCIKIAASECNTLYVILFYGGLEEEKILNEMNEDYLKVDARINQLLRAISKYDNVKIATVDCTHLRHLDGSEDWDAETPFVRKIVGDKIDAVYSSEYSYGDYFSKAYPEAVHRVVDSNREICPISGTLLRKMLSKDRGKYMI